MLKRTVSGVALVAVVVGFFFLRDIDALFFHALISIIALIGSFEINRMFKDGTSLLQKAVAFAGVLGGCVCFIFFNATGALVCYCVFAVILFFIPVFSRGRLSLQSLGYSLLSLVYPGALLIPLMAINTLGDVSFFALVLTFIISPCADVFAYLVGRTLKGKKLCPEISPNKTISGAIGGLIGGIAGGVAVYAILKDTFVYHLFINPYVYFAVVGLVAACLTELGDLVESFIKRSLDQKDSGKLIPGHGGMLDRVDGLIFASIFIYFVTALM